MTIPALESAYADPFRSGSGGLDRKKNKSEKAERNEQITLVLLINRPSDTLVVVQSRKNGLLDPSSLSLV